MPTTDLLQHRRTWHPPAPILTLTQTLTLAPDCKSPRTQRPQS